MNEFIIVKSTVMMIRISLEGAVTIYFFPIMTPIHLAAQTPVSVAQLRM